ncbi:hypothetical protein [Pyruvatibacter sp.]
MARIDEIAEGIASVLRSSRLPEPLGVDLWNETPAAASVLVQAVVDSCKRNSITLSLVRICPVLGKDLLRELPPGKPILIDTEILPDPTLNNRIEFFRFQPSAKD